MRPTALNPLFAPLTGLPGVGPRTGLAMARLAGDKVLDLIWHLPSGLIDRRFSPKLADAVPGVVATLTVKVGQHRPPRIPRLPYKVLCSDETGEISLVFFHARADYLHRTLPEGETRVVSGKIEEFQGDLQITHPDHVAEPDDIASLQTVEPIYPLTAGLNPRPLLRAIQAAVESAPGKSVV